MKLNYKRTTLIGLAFLSISAFWQMYDNIIPLILKNTFMLGETYTGVIMAADNILALFLQDYSYTEIGARIGKDDKTVDNALQRIRKKLRQKLIF